MAHLCARYSAGAVPTVAAPVLRLTGVQASRFSSSRTSATLALQSINSRMLFRLSDVHKSYGAQDVLRGTSFQINPGEHVGLVGRNGAGKTTIFRLVAGEETADKGDVVRARGVKLG